ncbi:MAG TPA: YHS domain-containing protein [Candidatus Omnitrophica bacterium]|nr:YHS domain-containing protein [Candidatus Omnitrophota bacterium]
MAKDPVCGMEVEEGRICSTYEGRRYCFCSKACKEKFEATPEKFVEEEDKQSGCCH